MAYYSRTTVGDYVMPVEVTGEAVCYHDLSYHTPLVEPQPSLLGAAFDLGWVEEEEAPVVARRAAPLTPRRVPLAACAAEALGLHVDGVRHLRGGAYSHLANDYTTIKRLFYFCGKRRSAEERDAAVERCMRRKGWCAARVERGWRLARWMERLAVVSRVAGARVDEPSRAAGPPLRR